MARVTTILLVIAAQGACAANPAPVPLAGNRDDLAALEGEWRGQYETTAGPARFGSILFRLSAGGDSARGDVLMVAHPDRSPPAMLREGGDPWSSSERTPGSQLLTITFVRASGGAVTGALEPYTDPTCGCTLRTTFTGRLAGDVVDGTFMSLHEGTGQSTGGRWRVTRHAP
jgi:hypothetical protein